VALRDIRHWKSAHRNRSIPLRPNDLLLIEKGEKHQIINTGRKDLVTINFYIPLRTTSTMSH